MVTTHIEHFKWTSVSKYIFCFYRAYLVVYMFACLVSCRLIIEQSANCSSPFCTFQYKFLVMKCLMTPASHITSIRIISEPKYKLDECSVSSFTHWFWTLFDAVVVELNHSLIRQYFMLIGRKRILHKLCWNSSKQGIKNSIFWVSVAEVVLVLIWTTWNGPQNLGLDSACVRCMIFF